MSTQILKTKLFAPPIRPQWVQRPNLIERLDNGLYTKLTLISAPAGFGKSTLLSQWIADCDYEAVWLSLDEGDSDLNRFLTYVVSTIQLMINNFGESFIELLQSPQQPPIESLLTTLINDIATIPNDFLLVLDDYHTIDSTDVDDALAFLTEHLPPQMHIVIATREDPQIPLARLRARGELTELRVSDLRFTADEAADFLNQMMNLNLSSQDILALETHTEGWVAGLQLAALSLRQHDDTTTFIEAFTGSHRFVLDYLVEEVLQHQPDDVRSFLLRTSVLERLNSNLCDALVEGTDSRQMLDMLERGNVFLISLDDTKQWYRYHHLFADALRTHLMDEHPDQIASLHQRASRWYQTNDLPFDAIYHALVAEDYDYAADLIEMIWPQMDDNYQLPTWLRWLKALPEEIVRSRPILSLGHAWAMLNMGDVDAAEQRLSEAEHWLNDTDRLDDMVVVEAERFKSLPATIASARAYRSLTLGDVESGITYASRAKDLARSKKTSAYRQGAALLGVAHWMNGDLQIAEEKLTDFMLTARELGFLSDAVGLPFVLHEIWVSRGRLQVGFDVCEEWLRYLDRHDVSITLGHADLHRTLAELHYERNNLELARQFLQMGKEMSEQMVLPSWDYRYLLTLAKFEEAQGNVETAIELLEEAPDHLTPAPLPIVRSASTLKARLWIRHGNLGLAWGWARQQRISFDDEITYLHEFDYITFAHLLVADYQANGTRESIEQSYKLLERLEKSAKDNERHGSLIDILIVQALAYQAHNEIDKSLDSLRRALLLSEPDGLIRRFIDEGKPMLKLLHTALEHDISPAYVKKLVSSFTYPQASQTISQTLIDPLSDRELEVLQLLGTDLTGPQIADELMISLNTMRTHTKNIYSKLDVNSRRSAVRRAEEIGFI